MKEKYKSKSIQVQTDTPECVPVASKSVQTIVKGSEDKQTATETPPVTHMVSSFVQTESFNQEEQNHDKRTFSIDNRSVQVKLENKRRYLSMLLDELSFVNSSEYLHCEYDQANDTLTNKDVWKTFFPILFSFFFI